MPKAIGPLKPFLCEMWVMAKRVQFILYATDRDHLSIDPRQVKVLKEMTE